MTPPHVPGDCISYTAEGRLRSAKACGNTRRDAAAACVQAVGAVAGTLCQLAGWSTMGRSPR
eukprot:6183653-Pleurochrysis_carterae.AAC.4